MTPQLLHQLGHNYNWNIKSLTEDKLGDGYIIGPKYLPLNKAQDLVNKYPHISVFDPQMYVPNIALGKLGTYNYFPCVLDNSRIYTSDDAFYSDCASECVLLQEQIDTDFIVIPTESSPYHQPSVFDDQEKKYVHPFLEVLSHKKILKPMLLQIVIDENVLVTDSLKKRLLNWLTSFPEIAGVYIIIDCFRRNKQLTSGQFLFSVLTFIDFLRSAGMIVLLGYQNTEALLLSIADPNFVTIGSYENLRNFSTSNFREKPTFIGNGPNPRVYYSGLLNWVDFRYSAELVRVLGSSIFDVSKYGPGLTDPRYKWHFSKSEPYLHYFEVFSRQINELSRLTGVDRLNKLMEYLRVAESNYNRLADGGVVLEGDSKNLHISSWLAVADRFAKVKGWA